MSPHLVVYVSHHGFGHGAQTTTVLAALTKQLPKLRITLVTGLPDHFLQPRISTPFAVRRANFDFGLAMQSTFEVSADETIARYRGLHGRWTEEVANEASWLASQRPDAIVSNVAYLPLAAAQRAGIRCAGMSSLNWADIFGHYFPESEYSSIHQHMRDAYADADVFVQLTPTMPMSWLPNRKTVAPVATLGRRCGMEIRQRLGLDANVKLMLVSFGGIEGDQNIDNWPQREDIFWLVPEAWRPRRRDMTSFESLGVPFLDVLCSSDGIVTKLGYGMVSETACNAVPVIFCERKDWPEEPYLKEWLMEHNRAVFVPRSELSSSTLLTAIDKIHRLTPPPVPQPEGAQEAAKILRELIAP